MLTHQFTLFTFFCCLSFCFGDVIIIDTLAELTGSTYESYYMASASEMLPGLFPEPITNTSREGFWLFASSRPSGASISLKLSVEFTEISLAYYNTDPIEVIYVDLANPASANTIELPSSLNDTYSTFKFQLARNFVDAEKEVIFKFNFPQRDTDPRALFFLDYVQVEVDTEVTTPASSTTPVPTFPIMFTLAVVATLAQMLLKLN